MNQKKLKRTLIVYAISVIVCLVLVLVLLALFEGFKVHKLNFTLDIILLTLKERLLHPIATVTGYIKTKNIAFYVGIAFSFFYPLYVLLAGNRNKTKKDKNSQAHGTARFSTIAEVIKGNNFIVKKQKTVQEEFQQSLIYTVDQLNKTGTTKTRS